MAKISVGKILILVIIDEIKKVLYFPVWWYTKGFFKVLKGCWDIISGFEQTLGLRIWVKNLFVPMFGQTDFAGRLISFFLRLFQIIVKCIVLILIILIVLVFIVFWLLLPVFIIYQVIINI